MKLIFLILNFIFKIMYKFEENIRKLSKNFDYKNEWVHIIDKKNTNGQCICQRELKHIHIFYNIKTKKQ